MMFSLKRSFSMVLFLFILMNSSAQKLKEVTHREVNIHFNDSSIKASILLGNKKVRTTNSVNYYWYYNNSIKVNQGGYKGRLLDGKYQVVSRNGNLLTHGFLKKGCQSGEWKHWKKNGKLIAIYNWKKGKKNSDYQLFKEGELVEKGSFKNGLLHGKKMVYKKDTVFSETVFKKGKEIIKEKKSKEQVKKEQAGEKRKPFWKRNKEEKLTEDNLKKEVKSSEKEKKVTPKKAKSEDKKNKKGKAND